MVFRKIPVKQKSSIFCLVYKSIPLRIIGGFVSFYSYSRLIFKHRKIKHFIFKKPRSVFLICSLRNTTTVFANLHS